MKSLHIIILIEVLNVGSNYKFIKTFCFVSHIILLY